jgi:hypothetical protein
MRADARSVGRLIKAALPVAGAVALTPLLVFLSTTNTLFIRNAEDFANDVHVLEQFLIYALIAFILGLALFLAARLLKPAILSLPFWLYILAGPFFLVYAFLHVRRAGVMNNLFVCSAFVCVYLMAAGLLTWKGKLKAAINVASRFFLVLFIVETTIFITNIGSRKPSVSEEPEDMAIRETGQNRPNIYHIILDGFGTDLFERTLTPRLRAKLGGFQYFSDNITGYAGTYVSVPSIFYGNLYSSELSPMEYMNAAFMSKTSLLHWLKEAGYDTRAFLTFSLCEGAKKAFRLVRLHSQYAEPGFRVDLSGEFRTLWLYAHFPDLLVRALVPERAIDQLKRGRVLPKVHPVHSYASFQRYLRDEERMPPHNRYTFLHLMIPHSPFVLRPDGSFGPLLKDGSLPETSSMDQGRCATNMIVQFTDVLKRLGRFDDSLVLIHADHGNWWVGEPGQVKKIRLAHALMLLKLPGRDASTAFEVRDEETHLIDVAPTVLDAVGIEPGIPYPGIPLTHPELVPRDRERKFVFYNAFLGNKWDPADFVHHTVRGRRLKNERNGVTTVEASLTQDEERYFNGEQPVSNLQNGGFEEFMTGWAGLGEAPKWERESKLVKFGKSSIKLTSSPADGGRTQKHIITLTAPPIEELRGKEVSFGAWVHTAAPDRVTVQIIDSWKNYFGASPTKANEWQLVIRRAVIPGDAKQVSFAVTVSHDGKTPTVCHLDGAALVIHQ